MQTNSHFQKDMNFFIKIKHWQFFLIIVLLHFFINGRVSFLIISTLDLALFSAWTCAISIAGQKVSSKFGLENKSVSVVKTCCFLIPILWLFSSTKPITLFTGIDSHNIWHRIIMALISIGFLVCCIYSIYVASKTIKTVELKHRPSFKNYILLIFGFIVWPIGLWFIQPKVNKSFAT